MFKSTNLLKPFNFKLKSILIKTNNSNYNLFMYNSNFYFFIKLPSNRITCNSNTLSVSINKPVSLIHFLNKRHIKTNTDICFDKLNSILFSWDSYFFKKFLIDGKAYRINKFKKGNFKLLFGRSHKTLFICKNVFLKKKKKIKKKFMFYCSNSLILNHAANITYRVRPNDLYTARGIRPTKYVSKRKLGKKGATSVI